MIHLTSSDCRSTMSFTRYMAEATPLNEMNALLSGQQVGMPSMPSFQNAGLSETPQMLSAANMGYGAQMDGYNAQQARSLRS